MTAAEIALAVNAGESYRNRDGSPVAASQVALRASNYSHLFDREGAQIFLASDAWGDTAPALQTGTAEAQAHRVARAELTRVQPTPSDDLRRLVYAGSFISAADADVHVPPSPGLYAIRLADDAALPREFAELALTRGHRIAYVGKATTSLRTRLVSQELRARGHGTFFRSIGAVLGFRPAPGSMAGRKNGRNYGFVPADEAAIIRWINNNMLVNWVEVDPELQRSSEARLIRQHCPVFNLAGNPEASTRLLALRAECVRIASAAASGP
ncbi:GIY-YIG nuclease family protein [Leucobacter aridicollis]